MLLKETTGCWRHWNPRSKTASVWTDTPGPTCKSHSCSQSHTAFRMHSKNKTRSSDFKNLTGFI